MGQPFTGKLSPLRKCSGCSSENNITGFWKCPVLRIRMGTPVSIRRERQKLLTFNRIVHGIAPHYLQELLLPFYRPTHSYNLRNADNLNFVKPQTRTGFLLQ